MQWNSNKTHLLIFKLSGCVRELSLFETIFRVHFNSIPEKTNKFYTAPIKQHVIVSETKNLTMQKLQRFILLQNILKMELFPTTLQLCLCSNQQPLSRTLAALFTAVIDPYHQCHLWTKTRVKSLIRSRSQALRRNQHHFCQTVILKQM